MGVEFYLVNRTKSICFDLGKGFWLQLPTHASHEAISDYISKWIKSGFEEDTPKEYFDKLSEIIFEFCCEGDCFIIAEESFHDTYYTQYSKYKDNTTIYCEETGSRYKIE